jgi:hypothetical protein
MTKAYLLGFIARATGHDAYSFKNPWYNPFSENWCTQKDEEEFNEFVRGWNEADSPDNGMMNILELVKG